MSCSTSTWPSQPGPAPMPIVGMVSPAVTRARAAAGTSSSTIAQAPAASSAPASSSSRSAAAGVPPLHPVAAQRVDRLRREAEVAHHRNAPLHQRAHRRRHVARRPPA